MSGINYLLEANLYLAAFYVLYYLFFRNETYYQLNRAYLLCSGVVAFIIPVVQVGFLNPPVVQLQNVVITTINIPQPKQVAAITPATLWPTADYLLLAYWLIAGILLVSLATKIYRLMRLSRIYKATKYPGFKLIELPDENNAFSFFNYLFISPGLRLSSTVIHHELVHIRQKHSWDIIYLELLKMICWFNPTVWLMQSSLKELHEFIADSQTVRDQAGPEVYTDFLINNAYGVTGNTLINTFFNKTLLKKRIMKLHQKRSGRAARLKYLMVLPLVAGLLCASTLAFAKSYGWIDIAPRYARVEKNTLNKSDEIRRLKVTSGNNSFIADKISFKDGQGKTTVYTAHSLTEKDKAYLLKTQRITVAVVNVDQLPANDNVSRATNSDTLRRMNKTAAITDKGYKYKETAYMIHHKANFRVIITEKNGEEKSYFRNSATAAQLAMLKNRYGYTFPSLDIFERMPPPPPVPAMKQVPPSADPKDHSTPPPPPPQDPKEHNTPPPPPPPPANANSSARVLRFFAPSVWGGSFKELRDHLIRNVHYPADAKAARVVGNVITGFTVNGDHKITDVKIINGIGHGCDEEIVRVLKSFNDTVDKDAGNYIFAASYRLINVNGKDKYITTPVEQGLSAQSNFLGDISVSAYIE